MIWVYLSIILLMLFLLAMYALNGECIRVFGCSLFHILFYMLILAFLIGQILLPMPQYYIRHQDNIRTSTSDKNISPSINKILEEEAEKSGIEFDTGSFKIIDSYDMNFNYLLLCSYETAGKEQVRIFQFEKNIFGNMRPKYPFGKANIIPRDGNSKSFYRTFVKDGIFGEYIITAGYADETMVLENYQMSSFRVDGIHPSSYFMWVDLMRQPWRSELVQLIILTILGSVVGMFRKKKRKPIKFYRRWRKGDRIVQYIKEEDSIS